CGPSDLDPGATYTIHITSPTNAATALSSPVTNTANVTTSNDGSDSASDSIQVRATAIDIAKVADNPFVSAGDPVGFTITLTNNGQGTASAVAVDDLLPTNPGLSWSIDGGTGAGLCSTSATPGHLTCGPSDLPAAGSYTVHISSPTTGATGGQTVTNTAD